jgi:alanine-synthesizing transaminase
MPLSTRTAHVDEPNPLARAVAIARARGMLDLCGGNPTTCGLPYDGEAILAALASSRALAYEPEPLGLDAARDAIAGHYGERGVQVPAARLAITASTSEAYAVLFKLLCDPGDEVLVPAPSYPLLAWLAQFESVTLRPYPLVYAGSWHVEIGELRRSIGPRTRAIVVVNPNNPTGSYLGDEELEAMLDLDLPIVSDEVFSTYPLTDDGRVPPGRVETVAGARRGLVFALSGLSKLAGLPQMKLGWIATAGAAAPVAEAMERLENVLDTYLSVGTPVQTALPALLAAGKVTAHAIRERARANLAEVHAALAGTAATVLSTEGGWYVTLRVPETMSDEQWALSLVEDGVYVQPGYFFDFASGAHLVVSLLTPPSVLREGMARIAARVAKEQR